MAAALRKLSLLAVGASAWDDAVILMQRAVADENWAANETRMSRQDQLLSTGDTGAWCLTSADSMNGIAGCWGTPMGQPCTRCVNGLVTCSHGTSPVLDFSGRTFCATWEKKQSCFDKGCTPGGCCEQTCCPPQLKKSQAVLIKEHQDRARSAAAVALKSKEADIKELAAEIKAETSELAVAQQQAPNQLAKAAKREKDEISELEAEVKNHQAALKKYKEEVPAQFEQTKKDHQRMLKEMLGEIDTKKAMLQKALANPFAVHTEKQNELRVRTGEIQKLEYTLSNEAKHLKAHSGDRSKELQKLAAVVQKRKDAVKELTHNPAILHQYKAKEVQAVQEQINAKEAEMAEVKKRLLTPHKDGSLMKMQNEIMSAKAKVAQAKFSPLLAKQSNSVKAAEEQAERMQTAYENRRVAIASESVQNANQLAVLQNQLTALKTHYMEVKHRGTALGLARELEQAKALLKQAEASYNTAKAIVEDAESKDQESIESMQSEIASKKSQRMQASRSHRSKSHTEMETFIENHEKVYAEKKSQWAAEDAKMQAQIQNEIKGQEDELKSLQQKLRKKKSQVGFVIKNNQATQSSDLNHIVTDVKDKTKVLAAKQKELQKAKAQKI